MIKTILRIILIIPLLLIGYLNISLYYEPNFEETNSTVYNEDVHHQLCFLKTELRNGAGHKMQRLFPEGFIFINVLYGLAWCDLIQNLDKATEVYQEGIAEINWAFQEIDSPEGKRIFRKNLPLEYGAFYRGWNNYLLGKKLKIQASEQRDFIEIQLFKENCQDIANTLQDSSIPYLETYREAVWPADMMGCMASLKIHEDLFEVKHDTIIAEWINAVKNYMDPRTGLIPHSFNFKEQKPGEGARGSSQSLMLNFLSEIDPVFSKEQFSIYKELFLDTRFGLPGIREYPKGRGGQGDVDSGPVILDIGGAASIVGQRTMAKHQDWTNYEGLRNCIESFGASWTSGGKKKYIFGELPMADAFIAWSNAMEYKDNQVKVESNWRMTFQLISFLIFLVLGYYIWKP